jgi:CRP-like cAMP-binding protein
MRAFGCAEDRRKSASAVEENVPLDRYTGKNRLLAALPAGDFAQLFSEIEPVSLSLRQVLQDTTEPVEYVFFVEQGVTSVLTIMRDGSAIEVGMIGTEGMVGVGALLNPDAPPQRVIVQIPGAALRMPLALCKIAFAGSEAVRTVMLRFAGALLNLSAQTAACNRLHSREQRCARWLLMAYDRAKSETMPMTHEFLATMLGVRRQGLTTMAGALQRSGLITYRQGEITIRDPEGLAARACECYRADHERLARLF